MCIPSIEARSTERGYESIVKYCFFIVLVLIDTWWNVNVNPTLDHLLPHKVLIDTWWNVNNIPFSLFFDFCRVLIDTWWNVNRIGVVPISAKDVGFNRYMVECEYVISK